MPLARHDKALSNGLNGAEVSTHMPLARHDNIGVTTSQQMLQFLLTCLLRGMTISRSSRRNMDMFLLTCLLRGMTKDADGTTFQIEVSTHMPLARHDGYGKHGGAGLHRFYSHASCEA